MERGQSGWLRLRAEIRTGAKCPPTGQLLVDPTTENFLLHLYRCERNPATPLPHQFCHGSGPRFLTRIIIVPNCALIRVGTRNPQTN